MCVQQPFSVQCVYNTSFLCKACTKNFLCAMCVQQLFFCEMCAQHRYVHIPTLITIKSLKLCKSSPISLTIQWKDLKKTNESHISVIFRVVKFRPSKPHISFLISYAFFRFYSNVTHMFSKIYVRREQLLPIKSLDNLKLFLAHFNPL